MKKILILFVMLCIGMANSADAFVIKSVDELKNDISARTKSRVDEHNNPCAIVRINYPTLDKFTFGEMVVGEGEYAPGECVVYLRPDSKSISYTVNGKQNTVNFADYDIVVEGKRSYRIILGEENAQIDPNETSAFISANYDNELVIIDGTHVGELPLHLESITPGRHLISVPNVNGLTMKDTIVNIEEKQKNYISLTLHKEAFKPFGIWEAGGGDSATWCPFLGIKIIKQNDKRGVLDYTGDTIVPCMFDDIYLQKPSYGVYIVVNNHLYGVYAPGKGLIIPVEYKYIKKENEDIFFVCNKNNEWAALNAQGKIIIPFGGDQMEINDYGNGERLVKSYQKDFNYYYDLKGNLWKVMPKGYLYCGDNRWISSKVLNDNGTIYELPENSESAIIYDGLIFDAPGGIMDMNFNYIVPSEYHIIYNNGHVDHYEEYWMDGVRKTAKEYIENGTFLAEKDGIYYVFNRDGSMIYDGSEGAYEILRFENGLFEVKDKESRKRGLFDSAWNQVLPCQYDGLEFIYDDDNHSFFIRTQVGRNLEIGTDKENVTYQLMDEKLNTVITLPENCWLYDKISNGICKVLSSEDKIGYINTKGEILNNCIFGAVIYHDQIDEINPEQEYKLRKQEYIALHPDEDSEFLTVIESPNEYLHYLNEEMDYAPATEGLAPVNIGDRFGFMDNRGEIVVPLIYTAVTPFSDGAAFVRDQEGKWKKIYRKDL